MDPKDYIRGSNGSGEAVRAIIVEEREIGDMSLVVDSVLNWPNKFVATVGTLDVVTGLIDPETVTIFRGHLDGSIVMIEAFAPGYTDVGNTANQVILLKPSTYWADLVAESLAEPSLPPGGATGDVLVKLSAADGDADWDGLTHVALVKNEVIGGTMDGVNTVFTLAGEAVTGTVELYKNGVRQNPGIGNDYTVAGSTITMAIAPPAGTLLLADYATSTSQFTMGVTGIVTNQVPTGLVDSSNTVFTCGNGYVAGTLEVWINGLKQLPGTHYTETTPASGIFTMSDAPSTGDNILVNYQHTLSAGIGDADTVDGFHANAVPTANTILPLDADGKVPLVAVSDIGLPKILTARINNGTGARSGTSSATPATLALVGDASYTAPANVDVDILFTLATMTYRDSGITRVRLHVNGVTQVIGTYMQGNGVWVVQTVTYKYQLNAGQTATWNVQWWQEGGGTASITNATTDTTFPNDVTALIVPRST